MLFAWLWYSSLINLYEKCFQQCRDFFNIFSEQPRAKYPEMPWVLWLLSLVNIKNAARLILGFNLL